MAKKKAKNRVLSKSIRDKIAKTEEEKQRKRLKKDCSPSSGEGNALFEGFGNVNLNLNPRDLVPGSDMSRGDPEFEAKGTPSKPKGLTNLGNTCFFNSVLQVLSQTPIFYNLLNERAVEGISWKAIHQKALAGGLVEVCDRKGLKSLGERVEQQNDNDEEDGDDDDEEEINEDEGGGEEEGDATFAVSLPAPNMFISAFVSFLREMRSPLKSSNVTPNIVLRELGQKSPQFKGREQQDSHELLRCLLDVIKTDEVRRQRKAIITALGIDPKNTQNVDDDTKARVKCYGHSSNFTLIDAIFGGYILSSVKCEECESTSQILEPFFDLSLPVTEEKKHKPSGGRKGKKEEEKESDEDPFQDMNVDSITEDVAKLSLKDRKNRRQQKKAEKKAQKVERRAAENKNVQPKKGDDDQVEKQSAEVVVSSGVADVEVAKEKEANQLKVDVNVSVSTGKGKVNVNVDIENNKDEMDCSVIVKCKSPKSNTQMDCVMKGDEGIAMSGNEMDTEMKPLRESLSSYEDDVVDTLSNVNGEADSEDEGISDYETQTKSAATPDLEDVMAKTSKLRIRGDEDDPFVSEKEDATESMKRIRTTSLTCTEADVKAKVKWTLSTVSPKAQPNQETASTATLQSCLSVFTSPELLAGANKLFCENCTQKAKLQGNTEKEKKVYTNASKQMLIAFPPPVLTLHLKRFQAEGYRCVNLRKINRSVSFPFELDLSPFVSRIYEKMGPLMGVKDPNPGSIRYSLYGIVEHCGTLRSGHYTAFVKLRDNSCKKLDKYVRLKPFLPSVEALLENIDLSSIEKTPSSCQKDSKREPLEGREPTQQPEGKWFHVSDSHVSTASLSSVSNAQAYILFYERICLPAHEM